MNESNFKVWLLGLLGNIKALPWKRIGLVSLCVFLALVLVAMLVVTAVIQGILNQVNIIPSDDTLPPDVTVSGTQPTEPLLPSIPGQTEPTQPADIIAHKDLVNIMLVGQDRREGQAGRTLSDVMILCTFNKRNNTITMTSFLRDSYVKIPEIGMNKMNQAYFRGGTDWLKQTMLDNFGVQVDYFLEVDFGSFKSIVNTLGGVEINLTAEEAEYMNTYILDGIQYEPGSLKPGVNLLNGDQALEYARIRKVGGTGDFGRTDRQRTVLDAIFNKCKTMDLFTALNMVNTLLPYIRTDIPRDSIISLATELFPLLGGQLIQQRVPADGSWSLLDVPMGSYDVEVIVIDFAKTHRFLLDTLMPK